jgi:hypothetical protein
MTNIAAAYKGHDDRRELPRYDVGVVPWFASTDSAVTSKVL